MTMPRSDIPFCRVAKCYLTKTKRYGFSPRDAQRESRKQAGDMRKSRDKAEGNLLGHKGTSRITSSFAHRSFHRFELALQNGVPYVPARGHTREPAQQGCPAPRTSNVGRVARQLV